jgi:hypothetical protein
LGIFRDWEIEAPQKKNQNQGLKWPDLALLLKKSPQSHKKSRKITTTIRTSDIIKKNLRSQKPSIDKA